MNAPPPPSFTWHAMHRRVREKAWLKALGTSLGITAFFIVYFALLRSSSRPVEIMATTWIDHALPFIPWALAPYVSLWIYVSLLPALLVDLRQLFGFALGCLGLSVAGFVVFYFHPTATPMADIDWDLHPGIRFLKNTDLAGNACPSLHVAFAVFTALWFERVLPSLGGGRVARTVNIVWAGLIALSTLAIRQHVALDAFWGAALGAWAAALNFIFTPCREKITATPRPLFATVAVIKTSAVLLWTSGVSTHYCLVLFLSGGALVVWHLLAPGARGLVRVHTDFHSREKEIWLTIDDGPDPLDTPRILELLNRYQARATFFITGKHAAAHPELVAEIHRRGHEIGHHTKSHPVGGLWAHSPRRLAAELDIDFGLSAPPTRFRAPVGIKNIFLSRALAARGLTCVGWSIRSRDSFARDPSRVADRVLRRLRPGAIILMHEGPFFHPAVRFEALRLVIEQSSVLGYHFIVPTADMLE